MNAHTESLRHAQPALPAVWRVLVHHWAMALHGLATLLLVWLAWQGASGGALPLLLGVAALLSLGIDRRQRRRLVDQPLALGVECAARLAQGDLVTPVPQQRLADSRLLQSLESVRLRMLEAVATVRAGTLQLAGSSSHLARDSDAIAQESRAQAAALQTTAQAIEQLTAAVRHNAQRSLSADVRVRDAVALAQSGGQSVREAMRRVDAIRESSRRIVDIIGVINGIAFQTNILALNAAVEAARAGGHGRGFAVVAGEVRSLAQRAAESAREIEQLIQASVADVASGHAVVEGIGRSMTGLIEAVEGVAQDLGAISSATQQQSAGIEHVNGAVNELDAMVVRNLQVIEEARQSVEAVNAQAVALMHSVAGFQLGDREFGTPEEARQLVEQAVAFGREQGRQALIDDINKLGKGRFIDRDLYLMVVTLDGAVIQASGMSRRVIGRGGPAAVDVEGRPFLVEMADQARREGSGWVEYKWTHPTTNEIATKATFVMRLDDVLVGCGAYKTAG